jgi:hypothetical protein
MSRRPERGGRWTVWLAWGMVTASAIAAIAFTRAASAIGWPESVVESVGQIGWLVIPVVFATAGALIVSRQPRNVIGWLLLTPAVAIQLGSTASLVLEGVDSVPARLDTGLVLAILVDNYSWMGLIFPLIHLLLVFPAGQVLSAGWRWLVRLEVAMISFLILSGVFMDEIGPLEGAWTVPNPIGFIPAAFYGDAFGLSWTALLLLLAVSGAISMAKRYRQAGVRERQQLKWLLFTFSLFAGVYSVLAIMHEWTSAGLFDLALLVSIVMIPVSIVMAVLRHHLFDIDVIIRRTLVYGALTGVLASVYFGSVVLFRGLIGGPLGGSSSWSVAVSTLLAAVMFAPARTRIQRLIDRRFFRSRYDAADVVARVAQELRGTLDLAEVAARAEAVVNEVFSPETSVIWLAEETGTPA